MAYEEVLTWRPSDPSGRCLRHVPAIAGEKYAGLPYEDFLCLYPQLKPFYTKFEMGWRPYWLWYWLGRSSWLPITSVILYGIGIVWGQAYFKDRKPWSCKTALMLWNLALSIFSVCGFMRLLFPVIHMSINYTMKENLCYNPFS